MNRHICLAIITGFLIAVIQGCATTETEKKEATQPDWVMGNSKKYPDSRYLTGQGSGNTLEDAKRRALADLATIFAVEVGEQSRDIQTVTIESGAGQYAKQEAERRIVTQTDEILKGAQISDKWYDPTNSSYHALAVIDRDQASEMFRQKLHSLDQETQMYIVQARDENDLLKKAAAAEKALAAQIERIEMQNRLQIIDTSGKGLPPMFNLAQLQKDLDDVLGRIRIQVEADESSVQALLEAGVSQAGFSADNNNPNYTLQGFVERTPVSQRDGVYWLRGSLRIQLRELGKQGAVRGTEHWSIKVSATDEDILRQRFTDQLETINTDKLKTSILGFALTKQ
jgi:hypothetical protein